MHECKICKVNGERIDHIKINACRWYAGTSELHYADSKITYIFSIKGLVLPKFTVMYYRKLKTFIINKQIGESKH